ncbi:hypothetical protein OJ996_18605 [Luteolibacter sp. GHJ8]|uniref:Zorya protein ZorC EH domain-containing protein n=1 Tax=Luteolibacter rhizosphaerae TaxID=2989719 RepID=A0ABT3G6X7_9BACT|nr:hypothetical protein [Luteolibacter rhizosphaerae]MCW1915603.1 hypothetical protein [Luteolibacter rhizosphaerae]
MTADRDTLKKLSALCGKLKSAWSLQVGFGTRLNGLLPEIIALPSGQIDACFERAAKGDPLRRACLVPIACEHLYHPSLHHRIVAWLEDDALPFRENVLEAIGRFRLREFAPHITRFFNPEQQSSERKSAEASMNRSRAIHSASLLKAPENLEPLRSLIQTPAANWDELVIRCLMNFPAFDAKPTLQTWFRNAEVIDEIDICERRVAGSISDLEEMLLSSRASQIWQLAEWYGVHERQEVIEFLVQHLDFDQISFSSPGFSRTIVCRGRTATHIIAKLNGWQPVDYDQTKEGGERSKIFYDSLWRALREDPRLAFQAECPVKYSYPAKHKIHRQIDSLLDLHGRVLEEDSELGYWLRKANEGEDLILAMHVTRWSRHWRMVRLSDSDRHDLASGATSARHLFFRYSSRGALVAFRDQILVNAQELENKFAKSAIRKLLKIEARKAAKKAASSITESNVLP